MVEVAAHYMIYNLDLLMIGLFEYREDSNYIQSALFL